MSSNFFIDTADCKSFFGKLERAARGDFRKELTKYLEELGNEFLRILEEEIKRQHTFDTQELLNCFHKGSDNNIWELDEGNLTLQIGTNHSFAGFANDGHWDDSTNVKKRFIPGYWKGDKFVYDPEAKEGIVLKQKWVEGNHYWESALRIFSDIYPGLLEAKLEKWVDNYFGK